MGLERLQFRTPYIHLPSHRGLLVDDIAKLVNSSSGDERIGCRSFNVLAVLLAWSYMELDLLDNSKIWKGSEEKSPIHAGVFAAIMLLILNNDIDYKWSVFPIVKEHPSQYQALSYYHSLYYLIINRSFDHKTFYQKTFHQNAFLQHRPRHDIGFSLHLHSGSSSNACRHEHRRSRGSTQSLD